jgi:hypothetical protein
MPRQTPSLWNTSTLMGRPELLFGPRTHLHGWDYRQAQGSRCHHPVSRNQPGRRQTTAASTASPVRSDRGRGLVRRSTATSCRSTGNSTSWPPMTGRAEPSSRRPGRRSGTAVVAPRFTIMLLQHGMRDHGSSAPQCRVLKPHRRTPTRIHTPRLRLQRNEVYDTVPYIWR